MVTGTLHKIQMTETGTEHLVLYSIVIINPRRVCAARVTVVVLSVCVCVCVSTLILALQATKRPISDTSSFRITRA